MTQTKVCVVQYNIPWYYVTTQVGIRATRHDSDEGVIAVDDLAIEFDPCPAPLDCTFEDGLCDWIEESQQNIWQLLRASDSPNKVYTDHTLRSNEGQICLKKNLSQ